MKLKEIAIDKLIPYENNPRANEAAVAKVANSIKKYGFRVPLVVTKDLVIVAGHTRVKACKLLGITKVPCHIAEDMDEQGIMEFRIADNRVGEEADWDKDKLCKELDDLEEKFPECDLSDLGFEQNELDNIRITDEDLDEGIEEIGQEEQECCDKCGAKIKGEQKAN
jgi:site-specific DNA-methyltransferase (adenine-specific)